MNFPIRQTYRLAPRRGAGLCCDKGGIALGAADLVRVVIDATGRQRSEVQPPQFLDRILDPAYGPQPEQVVLRLHRKLRRAASAIDAGDLCLAGIETVLLRLPDPTPSALAKLSEVAELHKWGTAWQYQPRVPPGQSGGGQWTTEDSASGEPAVDATARVTSYPSSSASRPTLPIGDGVTPRIVLTAGGDEEEKETREPKELTEFRTLSDVFGIKNIALHVALSPIDSFLEASALADAANLQGTMGQYWRLVSEIKKLDPSFADKELLPSNGIAGLDWQGRNNLINSLLMRRAAAYYRIRGDVEPLQVETLRTLQDEVDAAYKDGEALYNSGQLPVYFSKDKCRIRCGSSSKPTQRIRQAIH